MSAVLEILQEQFPTNEPIFTRDVMALLDGTPRSTVYYQLGRAVDEGGLARAARGVYYLPTSTVLGRSVISPVKTLIKEYITDGANVYGYWGGLTLENREGLTTQNPTVLEITTNKATKRLRRLGPTAGYRDVLLRPPKVSISPENVETLKFLDLVTTALRPGGEDDVRGKLLKMAERLDGRTVRDALKSYPSKTSKKLIESGLIDAFA